MNLICTVALTTALLPAAAAHAQFQEIVGDALTITAVAGSRSATIAIPRLSLVQFPSALSWQWESPAGGVNVVASDGTVLGSFSGVVNYDTLYDNILFDLTFTSGAVDTHFTARSADLTNSFVAGFTEFDNFAHLSDANGNGAALTGLFTGRCSQIRWNGSPTGTAIAGFTVGPGGSVLHPDNQLVNGSYSGTEALTMDFSLSAADTVRARSYAIVSIPGPSAAALAVPAFLLGRRRR